MEALVYFLIFMMGAFIGSFASLAVYRLPLKQDILYTHSYCPNCKEKLKTIDLIPIFSYLFLGGKCRACGEKIRPRYLILEICSGLITLLYVISTGFDIYHLNLNYLINLAFYIVFIVTLVLIAGIDKEHNKLQKGILIFGLVLEFAYLMYSLNIQGIVLLLLLVAALLLNKKENYIFELLALIVYSLFFMPIYLVIINLIILLFTMCWKRDNTLFMYSIITIASLIIFNFI